MSDINKKEATESVLLPTSVRALFVRYRAELMTFARRRVGKGPPEPEDLLQQAFANFAGVEDPASVKNPRAFLYRTIANLITDYRKSSHHNQKLDVDDAELEDLFQHHDEISPEIVLLDRERFFRVEAAIRALPRRQRRFLLLSRLEGMSLTEIARRNGVSISTARREVEAAIGVCREAVRQLMTNDG
ncbi:RNA polymerase sigma factor [Hyphococcus luteus]|nr:sigma-70 family RNA polymerase sigma factor [Marinicaulis flavus]